MIMPILIGGFGNILIPIMLGLSDLLFPRLNAFSLWLTSVSLSLIILSYLSSSFQFSGWTFYSPLSTLSNFSIDSMFLSLHLAGLASILGSINFIASILSRFNYSYSFSSFMFFDFIFFSLPLFLFSLFLTSILLIISIPVLAGSITMIIFDRHFNSSFFDPIFGGDPLLFQHLFWFFGHPEAYILILPSFGLISDCLSRCCNIIIFGRDSMIYAMLSIGLLGCIVWGHHMYNVGFDIDSRAYFTTATSIIAIPTGIKIFNWIATLWASNLQFIVSLFFIIGFLFSFTFGGFTGIILANVIVDILLHDTYFVVGHFHYVLSLGAVYTTFAAFYQYFQFISSLQFYEFYGRLHFISFFLSSNLLFFPMHTLGILGHSRRIFDYSILFSKFHWFQALAIAGFMLAMVLFSLALLSITVLFSLALSSFGSWLMHLFNRTTIDELSSFWSMIYLT
jgi:heme/copper-type cytochrome/quinol oxidase subunit 1